MNEQIHQPTKPAQAEPVKLSEKVTPALLDRMYNNFIKITDWVVRGKESQHPLPKALAWLFDTTESNQSEVAELKSLVTTLQSNLIEKEQRITALDGALQNVNGVLKQLVDAVNTQQPPATLAPETPVVPEPVVTTPAPQPTPAPAPVEVVDELVDLDDVASTEPPSGGVSAVPETGEQSQNASLTPPVQVSPNEQAIEVSAEAVGAGNIDPASYAALDNEIGALLGK